MPEETSLATRVITSAISLPIVKVNRETWLYTQLSKTCSREQALDAVDTTPAQAGISLETIDKLADAVIKNHVMAATSVSAATGIPGGFTAIPAVAADLAQFYGHALALTQKLAYLYSWPDLAGENGQFDEDTKTKVTILLGVMFHVGVANQGITKLAEQIAATQTKRIPGYALTKISGYSIAKKVLKHLGFQLTKQTVGRGAGKIIPLVGAAVSGGITIFSMSIMAGRLKKHLRELELAQPKDYPPPAEIIAAD